MKTIIISGSSGFIGKNLINLISQTNKYQIITLDINNGIDLTQNEQLLSLPPFDIFIHLANLLYVPASYQNPEVFYRVNYLTTLNALELCRKNNAKMIYISSYLYGNPKYLPIDENHPINPTNPYAQSKYICEKLCEGYHRDFGVAIIVFRPFNIYGPGQNKSFLVSKIIDQLKTGDVHLEDPRPKRDFIHVMDIVEAVIKAIESKIPAYEVFNLGSGKSVSITDLADKILSITKSEHKVFFSKKERKGEVMDSVADIRKAKTLLSWDPLFNISEGIKSII